MELRAALAAQGNSPEQVDEIMSSMIEEVFNGGDPEECLDEQGLEPDYVFDLLAECR